jgi:hypothetical protein
VNVVRVVYRWILYFSSSSLAISCRADNLFKDHTEQSMERLSLPCDYVLPVL